MSTFRTLDDLNRQTTAWRKVQSGCKSLARFALGAPLEVQAEFRKSTVPGMASTDSVADAMAAFKKFVLAPTVLAQLPDALHVGPLIPVPSETNAGVAYWVAENEPVPVARLSFNSHTLRSHTLQMLLVLSKELLRRGGSAADAAMLKVATRTATRTLDRTFLSDDAASASTPAGILNGMVTFAGGSPSVLAAELDELIAIVSDGSASAPTFIASPRAIGFLAQQEGNAFRDVKLVGGSILGAPLIASPGAGNRLILLDAAEVAIFDGALAVEQSSVATLEMSDSPSSPSQHTSLWQTDSVSLKLEYFTDWATLSDDACAALELTDLGSSPA